MAKKKRKKVKVLSIQTRVQAHKEKIRVKSLLRFIMRNNHPTNEFIGRPDDIIHTIPLIKRIAKTFQLSGREVMDVMLIEEKKQRSKYGTKTK